jgi:hypothetical protein
MALLTGVDETYYKTFVLTEDGLKNFHKVMENAAQRFPAPAELVYTIVTSDFRYFETKRLEEVTHDLDVQKKNIIQLSMESQFSDPNARIEGDTVKPPLEEWNVRVVFNILQKGTWDTRVDKISLRVRSEDRKWASDYINKLEDLIYELPRGERTPTIIFWLFAVPLFFFVKTLITQLTAPANWFQQPGGRFLFLTYAAVCAGMMLIGFAVDFLGYSPYGYRLLFGPDSRFIWGQGKVDHEAREYARQISMLVVGVMFILLLLISIGYAVR